MQSISSHEAAVRPVLAAVLAAVVCSGAMGCGRVGYAAGSRDAGARDAYVPPSCSWDDPRFDAPEVMLTGFENVVAPSYSADGLRLYFTAAGAVRSSTRASLDQPFESVSEVVEAPTAYPIDGFCIRRDGLELVLSTDALGGAGRNDLFRRSRASTTDPWGPAEALTGLNTASAEWDYFLEPDGLTLWFQRQGAGSSDRDIHVSRRATLDASFETATAVPSLSVAGRGESAPSLPDDRSVVVLEVESDLAFARITGGVVGPTEPLPSLSSPQTDYEPVVRPDGCEIVFISARSGQWLLYRAVRSR